MHEEAWGNAFIFSDGTGIAKVHLEGADVQWDECTFSWHETPGHIRGVILDRYGLAVPSLLTTSEFIRRRHFRFVERLIAVGSPVYIRGSIRTAESHEIYVLSPQRQGFLRTLASFQANPAARKKFFDMNLDQRIDERELIMGSVRMLKEAELRVRPGESNQHVRVQSILQHSPEHGLLIASHHQERLLDRLSKGNLLKIIGGAMGVAAGLVVLAAALGWV